MHKIKRKDLHQIESAIAKDFDIRAEYYMGITVDKIFENNDPHLASLYVINGIKR